ncbi:DUF1829 domain-containing protein [Bacillus salipaludis]|uniref:DUF1829 domain-containing protein n=1 Tax=Bacillus salipaludis TaxID=2547811 RepID=A0ABW8RRP5_9BACI
MKQTYKTELYVLINDQEKEVDKNILNAFHIEEINPVLWGKRESVIDILSA